MHASLHTLLKRIAMRGREFEKNIDPNYLQQLSHAYEQAMEQFEQAHPHIPVLRFNGDELDFVHRDQDRFFILNELQSVLKRSLEQ